MWLLNPGTVGNVGAASTYIFADLAGMKFTIAPVDLAPDTAVDAHRRAFAADVLNANIANLFPRPAYAMRKIVSRVFGVS